MKTILTISAHPDDETIFAGGTLAMYAEQGHDMYLLDTTRGEGGEVGDPPVATPETLGTVREQEARAAARALGAKEVFFLPYLDPHMEIGGTPLPIDVPLEEFTEAIGAYLEKLRPDLVITHGSNGEYGHPQHIFTHQATRLALDAFAQPVSLMTWSAWHEPAKRLRRIMNRDDQADIVQDITPWLAAKIAATLCHRTQHTMFLRNSGGASISDMVLRKESFHIWKGPIPEFTEIHKKG